MRKFVPQAKPEEIKEFIANLGYSVEDIYDYEGIEVIGFKVTNTALRLGYDIIINGKVIGKGSLTMLTPLEMSKEEIELNQRLYQKLYYRFREKN